MMVLELIPLLAFFGVYYFTRDIFFATNICIIASWFQLIATKLIYKKVGFNVILSTALITIFGGITVLSHNKWFVMIKPTILFWILALTIIVSDKLKQNPLKSLFAQHIQLSNSAYNKIRWYWLWFFILMGIVNLVLIFTVTEYTWVKFKVFGILIASFLLMVITVRIVLKDSNTDNAT